ncbi:MAG: YceD family protein [Bacilli bacterium]
MNIDLLRLKNNVDKIIEINENLEFQKDQLENTELLDLKDVKATGELKKDSMDDITLYLNVTGTMYLPCALTLESVEHKFEFTIDDKLENVLEEVKNDKKIENTIDILPIIWENILMEIPMRVVSPNAKPEKLKGDGWQFITEQKGNVNPELEKLKDLL